MRALILLALLSLVALSCSGAQSPGGANEPANGARQSQRSADAVGTPGPGGTANASRPHSQTGVADDELAGARQLATTYLAAHDQEIGSSYADYPVTAESSAVSDVIKTGDPTWPYQVQGSITLTTAPGTKDSKGNDVGGARWTVFPVLHVNPGNGNVEVKAAAS